MKKSISIIITIITAMCLCACDLPFNGTNTVKNSNQLLIVAPKDDEKEQSDETEDEAEDELEAEIEEEAENTTRRLTNLEKLEAYKVQRIKNVQSFNSTVTDLSEVRAYLDKMKGLKEEDITFLQFYPMIIGDSEFLLIQYKATGQETTEYVAFITDIGTYEFHRNADERFDNITVTEEVTGDGTQILVMDLNSYEYDAVLYALPGRKGIISSYIFATSMEFAVANYTYYGSYINDSEVDVYRGIIKDVDDAYGYFLGTNVSVAYMTESFTATYDNNGNLMTMAFSSEGDCAKYRFEYCYDEKGQRIGEVCYSGRLDYPDDLLTEEYTLQFVRDDDGYLVYVSELFDQSYIDEYDIQYTQDGRMRIS